MTDKKLQKVNKQKAKSIQAPAVFSSSVARMKIDKMKQLMNEVDKRGVQQEMAPFMNANTMNPNPMKF